MTGRKTGIPGEGSRGAEESVVSKPAILLCDTTVLKLLPKKTATSKRDRQLAALVQIGREVLASGFSISEKQIFRLSPSRDRFKRGDCAKAIRQLHRIYPRLRCELVDNLWTIFPEVA